MHLVGVLVVSSCGLLEMKTYQKGGYSASMYLPFSAVRESLVYSFGNIHLLAIRTPKNIFFGVHHLNIN